MSSAERSLDQRHGESERTVFFRLLRGWVTRTLCPLFGDLTSTHTLAGEMGVGRRILDRGGVFEFPESNTRRRDVGEGKNRSEAEQSESEAKAKPGGYRYGLCGLTGWATLANRRSRGTSAAQCG